MRPPPFSSASAGCWTATSGALHGFTRSAAGGYTTVDFPGATDSVLRGINAQGTLVGGHDLGDPNTEIGFIDSHGTFTSFEDPAAVPMQTSPAGINALGFISGSYFEASGNSHGFVRDPKAQFRNFDFPGADSTAAAKINDLGQVAGLFTTNFPGHGFILSGVMDSDEPLSPARFFSFDYPDSQDSGLRGINNSGQVAGSFRLRGDPVMHGFIATRTDNAQGDQNNQ